jgi:transcriptional regulator
VLWGHVSRANPLWRSDRVLCIFTGLHAYVSASWYADSDTVPTWNYQAVHAHGTLAAVGDPAEVRALFARLGAATEGEAAAAWQKRLSPAAFARLAEGIVWFRIAVTRIEAKAKLSQHQSIERRRQAIAGLRMRGDADALGVATAMAATLPPGSAP